MCEATSTISNPFYKEENTFTLPQACLTFLFKVVCYFEKE